MTTIKTPHATVHIANIGVAGICAAAAWLSFTALTDLAARSGIATAWLWPLIIDSLIVAATIAAVAGAGTYARVLLAAGAALSLAGNILHATLPPGPLPTWLNAAIAAVPPIALVAVAHLAVVLRRATTAVPPTADLTIADTTELTIPETPETPPHLKETPNDDTAELRDKGLALLRQGHPPRAVADQLNVHRSSVYRWRQTLTPA
ncbi:helix-turn-helix domain-containing protein [Rhodococcus erythropolis]